MLVLDLRQTLLPLHEIRNQLHRSRPVECDQRDDVVEPLDAEILAQARHPAGFELEDADRFPAIQKRERRCVVERQFVNRETRNALADQRHRVLNHRERFQPEEIHLQHPEIGQRPHRELADHVRALAVAAERHVIREIAVADHHARRVHARIARQAFQHRRVIPELPHRGFGLDRLFQLRRLLRRARERDVQLVRNHLRDSIRLAVAEADHAPDIAHHALRF